jgi:hypothetical protein
LPAIEKFQILISQKFTNMTCNHLKEIDRACQDHGLVLGRTDLVRLICTECGDQEVCPAKSVFPTEEESVVTDQSAHSVSMNVHAPGLPEQSVKEAG